jgi:hypothetical protein
MLSLADNLLGHINQNLRGSFYGVAEGLKRAESLAARVDGSKWEEVVKFLRDVIEHLHQLSRDPRGSDTGMARATG